MSPRDETLAFAAQQGDMDAFAALVERHKGRVYRTLYQVVGDAADAQDLAQEVFVKVFRNLGSYRGDAAFTTWLHRVTLNVAFDWLRARKRRPLTVPLEPPPGEEEHRQADLPSPEAGPEELTLREERRRRLRDAIDRLSPDYKEVVLLYHFYHLSYQQIADRLGVPVRTVETRLYRARANLKRMLVSWEGGERVEVQRCAPAPGSVLG
ncbi:RNA polymerase ECF-type sigma factor [Symbiobacterium thermophilum IAM 14863]|uniref:RNA polymerase sigma factor n=2 Tax=Symbiobacterium thermophilum TaxID=2734 RepID=Q67T27_SYMTH|nr:RNA polymerase ECF-type sigma factor [Symbiobacterium thermophilum IAM 14863]